MFAQSTVTTQFSGQAKRAEEMEVGIQEESDFTEEEISEKEISEDEISDKEESPQNYPAIMETPYGDMMPSRNRGGRGRGGHRVLRERENIKPAGRGRGARRGGFGNIKKGSYSSVLKDSKTQNSNGAQSEEIVEEFSSLSVSERKKDNDRSTLTTSRERENHPSGMRSPKKYEYTHDNMRDTDLNDAQSLDNCSNIGQYDAESEPESSVSIQESNHGYVQQETFARSESVMSQRDNFLYEESIDGSLRLFHTSIF